MNNAANHIRLSKAIKIPIVFTQIFGLNVQVYLTLVVIDYY